MDLNRREFSTAAGVSLSAVLAGCGALEDDSDGEGENETDREFEDDDDSDVKNTDDSDAEDTDGSDTGGEDETDSDEQKMHEDESVAGTILLSDDAEHHLAVVRHTFTWASEPPSDHCHVHVMVENTSDAEMTIDMEARIYGEDGTELSATTDTGVEGPGPGDDDTVYSLELDNCEGTVEYDFEVTDVHADDDEPDESDEQDDSGAQDEADEPNDDNTDETDGSDESEDEQEDVDDDDEDEGADEEDDEDEGDAGEDEGNESDEQDDTDGDGEDGEDDGDEETSILRVIVQNGDEDPIDHATVEVDEGGFGGWSETQAVDGQGRADFDVENGEYTLIVEADGYPTLTEDIEIDHDVIYTVTLQTNN
ncbi:MULTISPECIES: carboxypeptidase-like regulatory domain-containing protein [Natrialbaceae]|uniref:carboxypeptidase-like regulatory domain-containing protein n=1 Tax=Natrialbaceae TaxID=1644061 RepID=UPI00207CE0DD|nr:carboxypeptidase regulatory-like domain-containing protein [Natronococcus sp. CG52]